MNVNGDWRDKRLNQIAAVEHEIDQAIRSLKELRDKRNRLKRALYEGRTGEVRSADSMLVLIGDIKPFITQWIELYDRQHGSGGQLMLSERSAVSTRLIRKVVNGSTAGKRFVTLQTADRLLRAANMGEKVSNLEWFPLKNHRRAPVPKPPQSNYYEE